MCGSKYAEERRRRERASLPLLKAEWRIAVRRARERMRRMQTRIDEEGCGAVFAALRAAEEGSG